MILICCLLDLIEILLSMLLNLYYILIIKFFFFFFLNISITDASVGPDTDT